MKKEFAMKYALLLNEGVLGLLFFGIFNFFSTNLFWFITCCLLVVLSVGIMGYVALTKKHEVRDAMVTQYIHQSSYDSENVIIVVVLFIFIFNKLFGNILLEHLTGYQILSLMMGALLFGRTVRYWSLDKGDKYADN